MVDTNGDAGALTGGLSDLSDGAILKCKKSWLIKLLTKEYQVLAGARPIDEIHSLGRRGYWCLLSPLSRSVNASNRPETTKTTWMTTYHVKSRSEVSAIFMKTVSS